MATIKDYLKYYKNISFKENKLNINDVIIFSELSYIDWSNIVPKGNNKITLKEAFTTYQEFKKHIYLTSFMKENIRMERRFITCLQLPCSSSKNRY